MQVANASTPALPPELERAIFEIAAVSRPRVIPKFMLVALRVKIWVEPLLYRTLLVDSPRLQFVPRDESPFTIECDQLISAIHSKPSSFFRDSVRNLCLAHNLAEEEAIVLSACSAIENLWMLRQNKVNVLDFNLPLKRLHCMVGMLFRTSQLDFTHGIFSSITHLELFDNLADIINPEAWSTLPCIPHLTHLAFNDDNFLPICLALLPTWESLRVMMILLDREMDADFLANHNATGLAHDLRFVVSTCASYLQDWIEGIQVGCDYWSRAEDFIAKRESKEIQPLRYYIPTGDGDWVVEDDMEIFGL
ncbi:hypothetical protein C8R45DRAFT_86919 [Mycena sanguinolenta]|nr:hypothetical protein C8R45DRAFT_86919 [Mycena sanguinolenta]